MVDPDTPWIALVNNEQPSGIREVSKHTDRLQEITWSDVLNSTSLDEIYHNPFVYVYGLYSRHGEFYPPYNCIPDIDWQELIQNVQLG